MEEVTKTSSIRKTTGTRRKAKAESKMENLITEPLTSSSFAHREGPIEKSIEKQTDKMPSDTFLWLAAGSILLAVAMKAGGKNDTANFIGHWAPTILITGVYNKLLKLEGPDSR